MISYLAKRNRETRFQRFQDRVFEIFISNLPGAVVLAMVAVMVVMLMIVAGNQPDATIHILGEVASK